jgi:rhodanese-related sulfurtransferase
MSFLQNLAWTVVKLLIQWRFPDVQTISTDTLATCLEQECLEHGEQSPTSHLFILDARTQEEYLTSHIQNAQLAPQDEEELATYLLLSNQIVIYCSIGYRSAVLVQKLQQKGYTEVFNLEGSIFQWANEGRSLYYFHQRVAHVNPYSKLWQFLLHQPQI